MEEQIMNQELVNEAIEEVTKTFEPIQTPATTYNPPVVKDYKKKSLNNQKKAMLIGAGVGLAILGVAVAYKLAHKSSEDDFEDDFEDDEEEEKKED